MLITLVNIPHTELVGTLSVAGLLSGTPRRQQAAGAKGGLLQKIGTFGFLVLKDFGSILSMRPEAKAELLAALREIYDGKWTRVIGADGGRTLSWAGKIGLLFGCTRVYDSYYGVISELGDRFLLCRMEPDEKQFLHAIKHANRATQMRARLVEAVTDLFAAPLPPPRDISDREITLAERHPANRRAPARSGQARLPHPRAGGYLWRRRHRPVRKGPRARAFRPRLPGRQAQQGAQGRQGHRVRQRAAQPAACLPLPEDAERQRLVDTTTVAKAVKLPTTTARRALEELVVYGLAERDPQGQGKAGPVASSLTVTRNVQYR